MEREFKEILAEFLRENALSQYEFAKEMGIKPSQVCEWLKGKAKPGYDNLKRIRLVFGVSSEYFLGLCEEY